MQGQPKNRAKIYAIIAVLIIIAAAVVVVFEFEKPPKQTIYVLVDSGSDTQEYLSMVANDFMSQYTNVTIKISPVSFSDLETSALSALENGASNPQIIMYYPSMAPALEPYLYNLNNSFSSQFISESSFLKGDLSSGSLYINPSNPSGEFVGMPIHTVFGYILVYNKTIFSNSTLASKFKSTYGFNFTLQGLSNWSQLNDIAEFIKTNTTFKMNDGKYPLLMPDSSHHSIIDAFYSIFYGYAAGNKTTGVLANSSPNYWTYFGFQNISGKKQLNISYNNEPAVKALEMYKNLTSYEPSVSSEPIGYDQQLEYFTQNNYAMGIAWSSFIPSYLSNASIGKNLSIALLPGNYTGYSPTYLGVNPHSSNLWLDLKFLQMASSSSMYEKGLNQYGFIPATTSGLQYASTQANYSWLSSFLTYSNKIVLNITYISIFSKISPLFSTLIPDFNDQVLNYFLGKTSASTALSTAASDWETELNNQNISL